MYPNVYPVGDSNIRIDVEQKIAPAMHHQVMKYYHSIESKKMPEVEAIIPAYASVTITYNASVASYKEMLNKVKACVVEADKIVEGAASKQLTRILVPTLYGREAGPDLSRVAQLNKLKEDEVVEIHSCRDYLIYMMGFLPGFPYLGGLSSKIETPRLDNPRLKVEAGSVGIGGQQTGVYPIASPGGWNLIGKTPLRLFDPNRATPFLFQTGQLIRFVPISYVEYENIEKQVKDGEYSIQQEVVEYGEKD
jgi:inhibitor of KinA